MPENDKPIFPRSTGTDEKEKQKLYQETKQKLEDAEKTFEVNSESLPTCPNCETPIKPDLYFCLECGKPLGFSETPKPVVAKQMYGPPPIIINKDGGFHPRPAYGPPPIHILNYKLWIVVTGLILLTILVIYFFVFRG